VCIITSQGESRKNYYGRVNEKAVSSLVEVGPNELYFLKKESAIDCNQAELLVKAQIPNIIVGGFEHTCGAARIPCSVKQKVFEAIKNSPLVRDWYKSNLLEE
jgi:hypothetical protein